MNHNKVILMILDGWGIATNPEVSAIDKAKTPFINSLYHKYPYAYLQASGLSVGLPMGQMGNSEVGHTNIGAGRVVYQDLVRINRAFETKEIYHNPTLLEAFRYAQNHHKNIHLIGLLSDGGVHSHISHLKGLCSMAKSQNFHNLYIHAFTDGRDTDPKAGLEYIQDLEQHLAQSTGKIASVIGRYYAMDRDKRWERIKIAYDLLVRGIGTPTENVLEALKTSYEEGNTDEFVLPIRITENGQPLPTIQADDVVIFFNFRTDRGRELTQVLTQTDFPEIEMQKIPLYYITFTNYDEHFENVQVIFDKDNLESTLGEVLSRAGKTQIRIAETEKYPHVTFFFSGGREEAFMGEKRILCPSPKVATYDLQPEMSAYEITNAICYELDKQETDFICLNFANADMVGHTGVMQAAIIACETVDICTQHVVEAALKNKYMVLIIADHGNADYMINDDQTPNTAHTTNLVPCILVAENAGQYTLRDGILANIAPTILELMGIEKPDRMNEISLLTYNV